ncbi:NADH dehydrogenase [ubiquinone] 1 alpha subcomplex assembly factor 4 [Plasmopara halstedii]|uniref:NADH dehydrogenase [ubiquinone] 1 alpha subcomplex assembly factor 4 n=1 Tax=Plasmopara halstedii TaxID=4781 RepID=A0A0P1A5I7_PLAHL|nr:NADH dehydrogenase [ubiquinone] 1 alpha subcomplex assembly factor 4 [Plasmopara halstedii]CEG35818.1 NADH dehydrogenase [ubiquinone] 1 alpha subcomplex assembly factor 4 [Plasmopara halstedii]|eukprot:XP_024572187.1 NADH dehydrogenase [ubiquinone] 1 alpha subcomplex assembly factor 4 [Plasmopara halstedii]
MGGSTSKTSSAATSVLRNRVIRTNMSLEYLVALSRGSTTQLNVTETSTPTDLNSSNVNPMEMQTQLLHNVQKLDEYDHVRFLEQSTRSFESTASSYRLRSSQPIKLPTDKTSAASSTGIGGIDEEKICGRLTSRDLRTLLRLHYENPQGWTHEVLADKYGLEVDVMRNILKSVGPPNVLPPKGNEYPIGVWFESPHIK